jgi:hypothetical protein
VALHLWRMYDSIGTDRDKKRDALRTVAITYEAVAVFDQPAAYGERYATEYGDAKDASERLVRAMCIRRQLGHADEAKRDAKRLTTSFNIATAVETLCEKVRPIAMPGAKP